MVKFFFIIGQCGLSRTERSLLLQVKHLWTKHTYANSVGPYELSPYAMVCPREKSGIFGQTAKFGQPPCLFHSSIIGIKNKLTKQTVKILMRRLPTHKKSKETHRTDSFSLRRFWWRWGATRTCLNCFWSGICNTKKNKNGSVWHLIDSIYLSVCLSVCLSIYLRSYPRSQSNLEETTND